MTLQVNSELFFRIRLKITRDQIMIDTPQNCARQNTSICRCDAGQCNPCPDWRGCGKPANQLSEWQMPQELVGMFVIECPVGLAISQASFTGEDCLVACLLALTPIARQQPPAPKLVVGLGLGATGLMAPTVQVGGPLSAVDMRTNSKEQHSQILKIFCRCNLKNSSFYVLKFLLEDTYSFVSLT